MHRARVFAACLVLVIAGCAPRGATPDVDAAGPDAGAARDGGPSTPYAPLVPDPARAGELAFGFHVAGAFFPSPGYEANGGEFLFVDHAGTWWAQRYSPLEVRTGSLDAETLAAINAELLTGPWTAVDGERVTGCCDAPTAYLARDDVRASVYQYAPGASDRLAALLTTSHDWVTRLMTQGAPMTGPVRLELRVFTGPSSTPTTPWPLSTPMSDVLAGAMQRAVVFEGADASVLRATRQGAFEDGGVFATFVVSDVLPFADASGCLRPIGGMTCR